MHCIVTINPQRATQGILGQVWEIGDQHCLLLGTALMNTKLLIFLKRNVRGELDLVFSDNLILAVQTTQGSLLVKRHSLY